MISLCIQEYISVTFELWIKPGMKWNDEYEIIEEDIDDSPGKEACNSLSLTLFQG
jgi:hypothetical protein